MSCASAGWRCRQAGGRIFRPGNEEALAAAIGKALTDAARLHAMGIAGRALVDKELPWRVATDRLLDVYSELLAQRNSW